MVKDVKKYLIFLRYFFFFFVKCETISCRQSKYLFSSQSGYNS
jgi:hypothetical protein